MAPRGLVADLAVLGMALTLAGVVVVNTTAAKAGVQAVTNALTGAGPKSPVVPLPDNPGPVTPVSADVRTDATGRVVAMIPRTPVPSTVGPDPMRAAQSHLAGIAQVWHVATDSLRVVDVRSLPSGSVVRYQQQINGVPVFGGQIVQTLTPAGALVAAVGKTARARAGDFQSGSTGGANTAALNTTAANKKLPLSQLRVQTTTQYWWDATLGGAKGPAVAQPVYLVHVHGAQANQQWSMVVGADGQDIVTSWSETREAVNRDVCDAGRAPVSGSADSVRCGTVFQADRTEESPASTVRDVNNVFKFFGDAANFYARYFNLDLTAMIGADSGDGNGKALRGTVRICMKGEKCPYLNAFWDGEQMAFGEGVTTEDITGHELTHGVTQHISGLRGGQADALNEGMSDVFGKLIGITSNDLNDVGVNRWSIGAGSKVGAIRDMRDPTRMRQPDRVNGTFWVTDNSDPHVNDGVVNKTAFLITDGATFNGRSVRGLGVDKSAQVWFGAENLLTPRATFQDLGNALNISCASALARGLAGINSEDCVQVGNAVLATQLDQAPR